MTDVLELSAETLTGAQVRAIREQYHLSRSELAVMCGYPKTGVRIGNIEVHESWKPGDRERIVDVLRQVMADPPRDRIGRQRGETGAARAERLDAKLRAHADPVLLNDDDADTEPTFVPDPIPPQRRGPIAVDNPIYGTITVTRANDGVRDLTNSEVGVWQRCRRQWWFSVYRGLVPKEREFMDFRSVGGRVHRALAAWYVPDGQERTDPREALERAIVEDWTAIVAQERLRPSYVDDETSLGDLSARFHDAVSLERAMVEGYMEWLAERGDDAQLRVIASETEVSAILTGDVAGDHVTVRATGLMDVRVRRLADGVRLYVDHKTVGNFAQKRKMLHMDPQMLHYHLLEWLSSQDGEERCDGALYNMLRRVKRTAQAKPPFYERVEVHHNAYEIDAYRRRLLGAARDIMRAERELNAGADPMSVVYPNPTDDCAWGCDFYAVCGMHDDGSRADDAVAALYEQRDPMARYDEARKKEGA